MSTGCIVRLKCVNMMTELRRNILLLSKQLRNSDDVNVGQKRHIECEIIKYRSRRVRSNVIGSGSNETVLRSQRLKWFDINSAFSGRIRTGAIVNVKHIDPVEFLNDSLPLVRNRLRNALKKLECLKVNFVFCGEFVKSSSSSSSTPLDSEIDCLKYFNTQNYSAYMGTDLDELYKSAVDKIKTQLEEYQEKRSGLALKAILNLTLNISKG